MSFQPVIPMGGFAGWAFLQRTREDQQAAFDNSPKMSRDLAAFSERIGSITSAADLVKDRQLLSVALGAFGLDEDIDKRFFIRSVLEEGTIDPQSLSNRLPDKRYHEMSQAFGFDLKPPNTVLSSFPDKIAANYKARQFEVAVGSTAPDMRLVLDMERSLPDLAGRDTSEEARWFTIMGTPSMRSVFEKALNLPPAVATLDLDRQLALFRDKATAIFGNSTVEQFSEPEKREELTRRFLAINDLTTNISPSTRGATALTLLQYSIGYDA